MPKEKKIGKTNELNLQISKCKFNTIQQCIVYLHTALLYILYVYYNFGRIPSCLQSKVAFYELGQIFIILVNFAVPVVGFHKHVFMRVAHMFLNIPSIVQRIM